MAEMITELIRFEPKICICNGNELEFKRKSVSVMRDFSAEIPTDLSLSWQVILLAAQFCICNWKKCLSVINLDTTVTYIFNIFRAIIFAVHAKMVSAKKICTATILGGWA